MEQQSAADTRALSLATQVLNEQFEKRPPSQEELNTVIKAASRDTTSHIFYRAQLQRWTNWRHEATKPIMARTIPIFRALISKDVNREYHTNHAQLGYALKDQQTPNWEEAKQELDTAIDIRGERGASDYRSYEFNRALCMINLDKNFASEKPSEEDAQLAIKKDLSVAYEGRWISGWVRDDKTIRKWLEINDLDLEDLDR